MANAIKPSSKDDGTHHLKPKDDIIDTTRDDEMNLQELEKGLEKTPSPPPIQQDPHNPSPKPSALTTTTRWLLWFLLDQWFLLAMGAIILLSSQIQVAASQQATKRTVITYLSVSIIFFINGCTLPTRLLLANYARWKLHIFVQIQSYLVCSAATFGIVSACASDPGFMDAWLLIGFLFVGSAPTTMSSNVVMTRQAHGNAALTVVQSVIGQVLCPFLSPLIVQMYLGSGAWYSRVLERGSGYGEVYRRVFMQLGISLFLPMVAGQVVQWWFPRQCKKVFVEWRGVKVSSVALLTLVWQTFDQAFQVDAFESVKRSNIVFVVFICMALYFIWTAICFMAAIVWLPKKDVIACCYCCPAKALAMVVPLTSVMYINISPVEQSKMQIPAIIFQAFQVGIGGLMTIAFRRWIRSEEEKEEAEKGATAEAEQTK